MRLKSTEILQSHVRSYLARKQKKQEERWLFDQIETTASLHELLRKLLFAYDPVVDLERLASVFLLNVDRFVKIIDFCR